MPANSLERSTEIEMRRDKVHNEASETEAIDGVVLVEGPGGVADRKSVV